MRGYRCVHSILYSVCENISMWLNRTVCILLVYLYGENFAWKIIIPNLDLLY